MQKGYKILGVFLLILVALIIMSPPISMANYGNLAYNLFIDIFEAALFGGLPAVTVAGLLLRHKYRSQSTLQQIGKPEGGVESIASKSTSSRIPSTSEKLAPLQGVITAEKLKTLERLIRVSSRVKIDDMSSILDIPRRDLMLKLLDLSDQFHFKIEEDVIAFEAGAVTDDFVKKLEQEFAAWGKSTSKV